MSEYRDISAGLAARMALEKYGFRFSHSLGQNFILDDQLIDRILDAARICPGEKVLEIGPGAGVMTRHLAERGANVTAIELDRSLEPVLDAVVGGLDNVRIVYGDAMKLDIGEVMGEGDYRVVANLPYYITADVIVRMLTQRVKPESLTIMVQKEAAERMMAKVGGKSWCALAATVQYFAQQEILMELPPEAFMPRPHVDSALLSLRLYDDSDRPVTAADEKLFLRVVNAAFAMRRKTLANNLSAAFGMGKPEAEAMLTSLGLDGKVRGEALTIAQLAEVAEELGNRE